MMVSGLMMSMPNGRIKVVTKKGTSRVRWRSKMIEYFCWAVENQKNNSGFLSPWFVEDWVKHCMQDSDKKYLIRGGVIGNLRKMRGQWANIGRRKK